MNTKEKEKDPLDQLIKTAAPEILGKLIKELALARPEIRRECFEFLKHLYGIGREINFE